MRCYGARRSLYASFWSSTRPAYIRSNAGRNRAGAQERGRFVQAKCTQGRQTIDRGMSKAARHRAQLEIQDDLYDLELAQYDPDVWLHGTPLTTSADLCKWRRQADSSKRHERFDAVYDDPYEYIPDDTDWDNHYYDDWDDEYRYGHRYNSYDDWDDDDYRYRHHYDDVLPTDRSWIDLWVAGHVHDDNEDRESTYWMDDSDWDDWDWCSRPTWQDDADAYFERFAEDNRSSLLDTLVIERNRERHRAGERYFRQNHRTILKAA